MLYQKCLANEINYMLKYREDTHDVTIEIFVDFKQNDYETVEEFINAVIYDHNYLRPSYALNYKTPIEYRTQLGFK